MRFTVVIDSENAALTGEDSTLELASLLRGIARTVLSLGEYPRIVQGNVIRDRNGNTVGRWRLDP